MSEPPAHGDAISGADHGQMVQQLRTRILHLGLLDSHPRLGIAISGSFVDIYQKLALIQEARSDKQCDKWQACAAQLIFGNLRKGLEDYYAYALDRCHLPLATNQLDTMMRHVSDYLKVCLPDDGVAQKRIDDLLISLKARFNAEMHAKPEPHRSGEGGGASPAQPYVNKVLCDLAEVLQALELQDSLLQSVDKSQIDQSATRTLETVQLAIEKARPLGLGYVLSDQAFGSRRELLDLLTSVARPAESQPATLLVVGPDFDRMLQSAEQALPPSYVSALPAALEVITRHMNVVSAFSTSALFDQALGKLAMFQLHRLPEDGKLPQRILLGTSRTLFTTTAARPAAIPTRGLPSYDSDDLLRRPLMLAPVDDLSQIVANAGEDGLRLLMMGFADAGKAREMLLKLDTSLGKAEPRHLVLAAGSREGKALAHWEARWFVASDFPSHLSSVLCLAQMCEIAANTQNTRMTEGPRRVRLQRALKDRYTQIMSETCGGRSHEVIQTQVPLARCDHVAGMEYSTLLHAIAGEKRDRYVLVAPAGSGKTTQLLFAASEILRLQLGEQPISPLHQQALSDDRRWLARQIPVVLQTPRIAAACNSLEELSRAGAVMEVLRTALSIEREHSAVLYDIMMLGHAMFLIDGLDELDAGHDLATEFVAELLRRFDRCPAMLTSRTRAAVPSIARSWPVLTLRPLNDSHVREYVGERRKLARANGGTHPGLDGLHSKLETAVPQELRLLRNPIFLRLFCDGLVATPGAIIDGIPNNHAGVYEYLLQMVAKAVMNAIGDRSSTPEQHVAALADTAYDLMFPTSGKRRRYFSPLLRSELLNLLFGAFCARGCPSGIALKACEYYLSAREIGTTQIPPLFEALHNDMTRFAHRSIVEFLSARAIRQRLAAEALERPKQPTERAARARHIVFHDLAELGDDYETARFFVGMLLQGKEDWERHAADGILYELMKGMQDVRVLQMLNDVGGGQDEEARIAWSHVIATRVQAELGGLILRTPSALGVREAGAFQARHPDGAVIADALTQKAAGSALGVVRLLEPFVLRTPRNPYLMHFAVEALQTIASESLAVRSSQTGSEELSHVVAAEKILQEAWSQSGSHAHYGPPVPAASLREFERSWRKGSRVPRPNMVLIEGGSAWHPESGCSVSIPSFYMADTLVTEAQWRVFKGESVTDPSQLRRPQIEIIWYEAAVFAKWLFGGRGRLPTRSEWLRALCAGKRRYKLPWHRSTYASRANTSESRRNGPTPVDEYPPQDSSGRLYDLVGNLWQWSSTTFVDDAVARQKQIEEKQFDYGEGEGYAKMLQGGSYGHASHFGWCITRFPSAAGNFVKVIGARVCISKEGFEEWQRECGGCL